MQHRPCALLMLSLGAVLLLCTPAHGQVTARSKPANTPEVQPTPDIDRWRYMLDDLALEARTTAQEEKRPLLMAEVADAYWRLDSTKSRELFLSALEAALSLKTGSKESNRALHQVVRLAAKRDAALSRKLMSIILKSAEKEGVNSESMSVGLDLLDTNPNEAAQLAEAMARAGPTLDSAWFLLQLSKRDRAAADRVYGIYLGDFTRNKLGLDRLLWLAGYPFGYAEAFGGSDPNQLAGFSGLRIAGPRSNPALAQAFLSVAFGSVQNAIQQAGSSEVAHAESLNSLALFTTAYLLPEVQRYNPRAVPAWSVLYEQALAGTTAGRREAITAQIKRIVDSRTRTDEPKEIELSETGQGEDLVAAAEKLPSGCKRDTEYVKAALSVAHGKNFLRALEIARKIDSDSMREGVRQFLFYDMSTAAIVRDGPGNLDDAQNYAERVTAPEQRALLYVKIARVALSNKDRFAAAELLRKTMRLADTISEPTSQAGVLLAAAARFAEFDVHEAYRAIKEAVKAVNRARSQTVEDFSVLRKVNLGCLAGEDTWFGDSQRAERFNLFETFARMATADVDGMLYVARELEDPFTRIRSLIAIVRAMTEKSVGSAQVIYTDAR